MIAWNNLVQKDYTPSKTFLHFVCDWFFILLKVGVFVTLKFPLISFCIDVYNMATSKWWERNQIETRRGHLASFYISTGVSISHLKYQLILLSSPTLSPPTCLPHLAYPSKWYHHPPSCSRYKSSLRSTLTHLLSFSQPSASFVNFTFKRLLIPSSFLHPHAHCFVDHFLVLVYCPWTKIQSPPQGSM